MEWNEFLAIEQSSYDTIFVKKTFVDIAKDLSAGILLSQIIYWFLPDKKGKTKLRVLKDDNLWLSKSYKEWWDEIRLTEGQVRRATNKLKKINILTTKLYKFNGAPTLHYRLIENRFLELYNKIITNSDSYIMQESILSKRQNGSLHNARIHSVKTTESLTETTTKTTTETKIESTPPAGELTPQKEEKTPLRAINDKISNLPKNRRNAQNEWFMVPDKLEFEFHDPEHIKLLNKPDEEIIVGLTHFLENDDKREILETDIDIFFRFARKEKVSEALFNKIKNIDYILDKFDYKQYLKGFEIAQARGEENKLSYLRKVLEKSFMPKVYIQQKHIQNKINNSMEATEFL